MFVSICVCMFVCMCVCVCPFPRYFTSHMVATQGRIQAVSALPGLPRPPAHKRGGARHIVRLSKVAS